MSSLKDSTLNIEKISHYKDFTDHTFLTTDPSIFEQRNKTIKNLHYLIIINRLPQ